MTALYDILLTLIDKAERDGAAHPVDLKHGLTISLQIIDGAIVVRLWRQHVFPSEVEWRTVLDHLPGRYRPLAYSEPVRYAEFERHVLSSTWLMHVK